MRAFIVLFILLISSCTTIKEAPLFNELPNYTKGSHVRIQQNRKFITAGELIEVQENYLICLQRKNGKTVTKKLSKEGITYVQVILSQTHSKSGYTRSHNIGLMTIGHGWWSVFTLPINAAVIATANKTFRLKVPWSRLHRYARFPQGIPQGVSPEDL